MTNANIASEAPARGIPHWLVSLLIMLAILVANTVLIIGLLQVLTWPECVFLVLAGVALSSGVLFTFFKMGSLANEE